MRCFSSMMSQQVKFWITSCWWRIILDLFTHSEQHLNGGGARLGILENQIFLDLRGRSFEIWSWACSVTAVGVSVNGSGVSDDLLKLMNVFLDCLHLLNTFAQIIKLWAKPKDTFSVCCYSRSQNSDDQVLFFAFRTNFFMRHFKFSEM